uniref:CBS domain-containing protein n=1 Tax=Alexandrium monilatum TaxID=311494 RepID=A0A6T1JHY0_9DINO
MAMRMTAVPAWQPLDCEKTAPQAMEACPAWQPASQSAPATVASIVGLHGTVVCPESATLSDVADLLMAGDRSAAAVVGDDGAFLGAITENDIARAYVEGSEEGHPSAAAAGIAAGAWLRSGMARCPASLADAMTVGTGTLLCEAAEKLRVMALGDSACRHLVVRDKAGKFRGMLSSLDLARALCDLGPGMEEAGRRIGGAAVADVMKPRAALPTCPRGGTLGQALRSMLEARQNCVLVTDADFCPAAQGIVTPRDALRAFVEHVPLDVTVGHWLRGLQSALLPRVVAPDMRLARAAQVMARHSVHHLVAVSPVTGDVEGVVSSCDVAHAVGSAERVVVGYGPRDS